MNQHRKKKPANSGLPVIEAEKNRSKRRMNRTRMIQGGIGLVVGCAVVIGLLIYANNRVFNTSKPEDSSTSLFVEDGNKIVARVNVPLEIRLGHAVKKSEDSEQPRREVVFTLDRGPQGCRVDRDGMLRWTPGHVGNYPLQVTAVEADSDTEPGRKETREWTIAVDRANRPPEIAPIAPQSVRLGEPLKVWVRAADPDKPSREIEYRLLPDSPRGASIDPKTGVLTWIPKKVPANSRIQITVAAVEAVQEGLGSKQSFMVDILPARDMSELAGTETPTETPTSGGPNRPTSVDPIQAEREKLRAELLELYDKKQVFALKSYPTFRRVYARFFELDHAGVIQAAYGENRAKVDEFFKKYPVIKEELYTAIDPKVDNMERALGIFAELIVKFPEAVPAYYEAAIATAVTWDAGPRPFSYAGHQQRTQSKMPNGLIKDGIANFEYLLQGESVLGRRVRAMPWEFLVHVVNHQTPLVERQWAIVNYGNKQVGIGQCYKDVPYDTGLRDRGGSVAKLKDQDYSLPEIQRCGGVCAMQADYASRVAKSLGVPGFYTNGESKSLDRHAWIVWVELYHVEKDKIQFEVKSFGRYYNDKYYVGSLREPKSGGRITDRLLELRLHNIGFGVTNKRQAELIMRTYPLYCKRRNLDVLARLRFLGDVIDISPGTESAWLTIARMSSKGEVTMKHNRQMKAILDRLFDTFANFPDFTWVVFSDLIAYRENPKEVAKLYERLAGMYIVAQRPDLGCEAALRYADFAMQHNWPDRAVDALATMILAFPGEGRYVPKMLDRLEGFVDNSPQTKKRLIAFYKELLQKMPKYRQKRFTKYAEKMYEKGINFFESVGETEAAAVLQTELSRLKAVREIQKKTS
ncbi:MAG: cadherin repeat domain-containing protein [Planctomycetia bacterium]|jgi:hypothetical protein